MNVAHEQEGAGRQRNQAGSGGSVAASGVGGGSGVNFADGADGAFDDTSMPIVGESEVFKQSSGLIVAFDFLNNHFARV